MMQTKIPTGLGRRTLIKSGLAVTVLAAPPIIGARGETPVRIGMVNPLTGILTFSSLIRKNLPDGSADAEDLDLVIRETTQWSTSSQR